MAMLLVIATVVFAAGCAEPAEPEANETSEEVTNEAVVEETVNESANVTEEGNNSTAGIAADGAIVSEVVAVEDPAAEVTDEAADEKK